MERGFVPAIFHNPVYTVSIFIMTVFIPEKSQKSRSLPIGILTGSVEIIHYNTAIPPIGK
jgi:hypothetical protein